jgi:hypothetical protein
MTTLNDLITQVRQQLLGYTLDQASVSELAAPMAPGDTTFTVDTGTVTNLSRGLVEIDDELILVKAYDRTSGVVTVMGLANGRGAEATTAASHAVNALVTASPPFPRARIKEAINQAILGLYPSLVSLATTEITNISVVYQYEMPADAVGVRAVALQTIGPTKVWQQGRSWRFDPRSNTGDFPTGKSIQLFDAVVPGRAMRVLYEKAPSKLDAGTDDFEAVTGYPDRVTDLVIWGACSRLIPAYDTARLQQQAVESTERAGLVPPTSALKTASYYQQLYYQRLEEEKARQFEEDPFPQFFAGS